MESFLQSDKLWGNLFVDLRQSKEREQTDGAAFQVRLTQSKGLEIVLQLSCYLHEIHISVDLLDTFLNPSCKKCDRKR